LTSFAKKLVGVFASRSKRDFRSKRPLLQKRRWRSNDVPQEFWDCTDARAALTARESASHNVDGCGNGDGADSKGPNPITTVTVSAGINASSARTAENTTRGAEVATQQPLFMTAVVLMAIIIDRRAVTFRTLAVAAMIVLASAQAHSERA
jgi:hypothetical protein